MLPYQENKTNAIQVLDELVTWTDCEVLILFKKQSSGGAKKKGRRLMGHADATLLSDPSSSETLAAQTLSGIFQFMMWGFELKCRDNQKI